MGKKIASTDYSVDAAAARDLNDFDLLRVKAQDNHSKIRDLQLANVPQWLL